MALCQMYFAPPGAGKTTLAVAKAQKFLRQGRTVFTNFPCFGCYKLDSGNIGKYQFKNAVVIVDEAGIDFNNRDWKKFSKETTQYVKLHRHYGTDMLFFSQGWEDCDKKIRDLCTEYFYLWKVGKTPLTIYRLIAKRIGVDSTTKQIIDEYYKVSPFRSGVHFLWRSKWYKFFDSWDAPVLPSPPLELWEMTTDTKDVVDYKVERNKHIDRCQSRWSKEEEEHERK